MKTFLLYGLLLLAATTNAQITPVKINTTKTVASFNSSETQYRQLQKNLALLEQQKKEILKLMEQHAALQQSTITMMQPVEGKYDSMNPNNAASSSGPSAPVGAASGGSSQDQLLNATKQMQETQMSFNLQYLQLQSQMQHENRSYTAISNIMKTKHDTVKNSISNIR